MKTLRSYPIPGATLLLVMLAAGADAKQVLKNHVPAAVARARRNGPLSGDVRLSLAVGLPLRNPEQLDRFLTDLADPASARYRSYLTPQQFAMRFGPTEADYQKVVSYLSAKGLIVTGRHSNRMIVDVSGPVSAIETAFDVRMMAWTDQVRGGFYAPDREPSVDDGVPILDITGLDNYVTPKPMNVNARPFSATSNSGTGSGPSGLLIGKDFRAAYAPDVTLTGAGQTIGLFELDGFYPSDVQANFSAAGLPPVPVSTVLVDGFSGAPGGGNIEVMLDIMMAAYMAPGVSNIIVYEGYNWNDVLNRMATDDQANQLSCSWGFSPINATTEQIFRQMIAQGQSLFQASGDSGAYTNGVMSPSDDPNLTVVGGTGLSTSGPGGSWLSESAWSGSGGGVSTTYSIPSYQQIVNMAAIGGSATMRNIPDVALTAAVQMFLIQSNGQAVEVGGTSAAAPLWAGFMALANQQAKTAGNPPVGFLNPPLYAIGAGSNYQSSMHDIVLGNNGAFETEPSFDLVTGWGSPAGQQLINQLTQKTAAPSFLLSASSTTLAMSDGSTAVTTVSTTAENGFTGKVSLAVSGLPAGVTASFGTTGLLTLTASATAAAGTSTITVTGTSGALVTTLPLTLSVTSASGFTLSAAPASLSLPQGGSGTSTVSTSTGVSGKVTLSLSGLPSGVTAAISASGVITFSAGSSAATGASTITVTGTSGSITKTTTIALTVTAAPTFSIAVSPPSLSIGQGSSGTSSVSVSGQNGFSGKVTVSVSGIPAGVTGSFSSTGVLTLTVGGTAATGASSITVTGTSGSVTKTATIALTITAAPSFTISANPTSLSVVQGSTGTNNITVATQNSFTGRVVLSASGLPSGVTASFGSTNAMTVTAGSAAAPGTSVITVTGTSGATIRTATVALTVTAAPGFAISMSPMSLSVARGTTATGNLGVTPQNGFSGKVTFTAGTLPAGLSASFSSTGVLTLSASATAAPGNSTLTVTGSSGNLTASLKVPVSVIAPPDFGLSLAMPILNIIKGFSGTTAISLAPQQGFTGNIVITAAGLPSGVTAALRTVGSSGNDLITVSATSAAASGHLPDYDHRHFRRPGPYRQTEHQPYGSGRGNRVLSICPPAIT